MTLPSPFLPDSRDIHVVVETPRGSRNKYTYQPGSGLYKLSKILPAGMAFPYDFGFIPGTRAEDGDPLDVLLLIEEPAYPGCIVESRVAGLVKGEQEEDGKKIRNDRIIAVALASTAYSYVKDLESFDNTLLGDLVNFLQAYHKNSNDNYTINGIDGPDIALELITKNLLHGPD